MALTRCCEVHMMHATPLAAPVRGGDFSEIQECRICGRRILIHFQEVSTIGGRPRFAPLWGEYVGQYKPRPGGT
jgi:hypothetical protein